MSKYFKIIGIVLIISNIAGIIIHIIDGIARQKIFGIAYTRPDSFQVAIFFIVLFALIVFGFALGLLFLCVGTLIKQPTYKNTTNHSCYEVVSESKDVFTEKNLMKVTVLEVEEFSINDKTIILNANGSNIFLNSPCCLMLHVFKNRISYIELSDTQELKVLILNSYKAAQEIYEILSK